VQRYVIQQLVAELAGIFSDKLNPPDEEGNIDYGASIGIQQRW
jgi:hypothetical protein